MAGAEGSGERSSIARPRAGAARRGSSSETPSGGVPEWLPEPAEQGPDARQGVAALERLTDHPGVRRLEPEPCHVPRIELAQVAGGASLPEVLDSPLEGPVELGEDLLAARAPGAPAEQLGEQPRVAEG